MLLQACSLSTKKEALSLDVTLISNSASISIQRATHKQGAAHLRAHRRHQGGVWGIEAMGTVKPNPPSVIGAWGAAGNVRLGECEAAVAIGTDAVMIHAMPGVANGNAHVAASVAHAVVDDGPLKAKMFTLCKKKLRMLNND